jgi:hypothetical protein
MLGRVRLVFGFSIRGFMDIISPDPCLGHGSRQRDVDRAAGEALERAYRGLAILLFPRPWGGCAACWCDGQTHHWLGFHPTTDSARHAARDAIDQWLARHPPPRI